MKAPLPLLALWLVGVWAAVRRGDWVPLAPAIAVLMILIVAISIQYKEGVRHLLVVFPLLAMVAGYGASVLWKSTGKWKMASRAAVVVLLAWQGVASLSAGRDFISYYNELAGRDPSKIYFTGCDLDCGQDVYRLAQELAEETFPIWRLRFGAAPTSTRWVCQNLRSSNRTGRLRDGLRSVFGR